MAFIAGPPCETWTVAKENEIAGVQGPRPVRNAEYLWGFEAMTIKELYQVCIGNDLLIFALEATTELSLTQGCAIVEHPAQPNKPESASIWRLPVIRALMQHPNGDVCQFCQRLLGAPTPKRTQLLVLNVPNLIQSLHRWRVRRERPRQAAIGLDDNGLLANNTLERISPCNVWITCRRDL